MNNEVVDCDALAKVTMELKLDGRALLVIYNALTLMSQNELPNTCETCDQTLHQLLPMFSEGLEHLKEHTK